MVVPLFKNENTIDVYYSYIRHTPKSNTLELVDYYLIKSDVKTNTLKM